MSLYCKQHLTVTLLSEERSKLPYKPNVRLLFSGNVHPKIAI